MSLHEKKSRSQEGEERSLASSTQGKKYSSKEKNKNLMSHKKKRNEKANKRREKMWNMCVKRGTGNQFWCSKIPFVNHFKQIFSSDRQMMRTEERERAREEITNWISIIFLFSQASLWCFYADLRLVLTPFQFSQKFIKFQWASRQRSARETAETATFSLRFEKVQVQKHLKSES